MRNTLVIILLSLVSGLAHAEGFKSKNETKVYAEKLMDHFVKTEFEKGLNDAKKYWPIPEVEIDGMKNQINLQWPIIDQRFGKPISKEFIKEKNIGESFVRYYFLQKFEKHSIYWQIDFYKARELWKVNSILFLDNLEPLFE